MMTAAIFVRNPDEILQVGREGSHDQRRPDGLELAKGERSGGMRQGKGHRSAGWRLTGSRSSWTKIVHNRIHSVRNGFFWRSSPIVVSGPCPGTTMVSSGSAITGP